jgi:hypothetical protein
MKVLYTEILKPFPEKEKTIDVKSSPSPRVYFHMNNHQQSQFPISKSIESGGRRIMALVLERIARASYTAQRCKMPGRR